MKHLHNLAFLLLLAPLSIFGQTLAGVNGDCQVGGQQTLTSGLPSTGTQQIGTTNVLQGAGVQASFPSCLITVYFTGTINKANIFSNNNITPTPLSNPFTANGDGSYTFFASNACYDVVLSSGTSAPLPYSRTLADVCPGGNGSGGGGGGSVGPGTPTHIPVFTSTTNVGDSEGVSTGISPVQWPLGVNLVSGALFASRCRNASTGTTANLLVAVDANNCFIIAQPTDTNNLKGIARTSGTGGNVDVAYSGSFPCQFDNQTGNQDWVVLGSGGQCHDAGATQPSGVEDVGRINSVNAGAGTLAIVELGFPDATNTSTGGGTGIVGPCAVPGAVGYYPTVSSTIGCDPSFTTDGAGGVIGVSLTLNGPASGSLDLFGSVGGDCLLTVGTTATQFQTACDIFVDQGGSFIAANTSGSPSDATMNMFVTGGGQGNLAYSEPGGSINTNIRFNPSGAIVLNSTPGGADDGAHGIVIGNSGLYIAGGFTDGTSLILTQGNLLVAGGSLATGNPIFILGSSGVEGVFKTVPSSGGGTYTIRSPVTAANNSINLANASGTMALLETFAAPPAIGNTTPAAGTFSTLTSASVTVSGVTGSVQCLHVNSSGLISGTGTDCGAGGGGGVSSVSGTAAQITVVNGSTTPTVSIPATFTFPGTVTNALNIFGATTSAQFFGVISDESGTGAVMGNNTPTILTPTIASFVNATHSHQNAAGGGTLDAAAIASGTIASARIPWTAPGTIGSVTPNTGAFTTLSATGQFTSTLATGTAPFSIASTTVVPNLNASLLLGGTWAIPGQIGSTTPNTVNANGLTVSNVTGLTQCLHVNTSGVVSGTGVDCSSAGSPGGSTTQIQYNNLGAFAGDSTFTLNSTSKQVNISYMASMKGPATDPRVFGCNGDGTDTAAAATTCWTSAEAQIQSTGGYIYCLGLYTLNPITLHTADTVRGPSGMANQKGCRLTANGTTIFNTTPLSFVAGITIEDVYLVGGTNAIDFPQINEANLFDIEGQDQTGCLISIVAGERWTLQEVTGSWTNTNGFATLCTGDPSKSVFSASIPGSAPVGSSLITVRGLNNLTDAPSFSSSWLWWEGTAIDAGKISGLYCAFGCQVGVLSVGTLQPAQNVLVDTFIDGIDLDHVGLPGTPEAIGINIAGTMRGSTISHYNPCWNTNYQTVQMYIEATSIGANLITNSIFCNTVDNASTFGLKFGNHSGLNFTVLSSYGGLYVPPAAINETNEINVLGSVMTPTNVPGAQLTDVNDTGWQGTITKSGNSSAATALYAFKRGAGANAFTTDFSSSGSALTLVKDRLTVAGTAPTCAFSTGGGTSPSCSLDTGSSDNAGIIKATTGTGAPGATGTITLTFSIALGTNKPVCQYQASDAGTAAWTALPAFKDLTPTTASDIFTWTNGTVPTALAVSSTYWINYQCWAK